VADLHALAKHPDARVRNYAMVGVWLIRALRWGTVTAGLGLLVGVGSFPFAMGSRDPVWMILPWGFGFTLGGGLVGAGLPLTFAAWHFGLHILAEAIDVLKGR
jgi:hypothetical protein